MAECVGGIGRVFGTVFTAQRGDQTVWAPFAADGWAVDGEGNRFELWEPA